MNTTSLIEAVRKHFPQAVSASHTFRGDATVILRPEFLLEVARFLKEDPGMRMSYLMDLTAVDYSAFGKRPTPAFFASSGVAVSPSSEIPSEKPPPGPPGGARFAGAYPFFFFAPQQPLRPGGPAKQKAPRDGSPSPFLAAARRH